MGSKEKWNILSTKFRAVLTGFPLKEANRDGCLSILLTKPDLTVFGVLCLSTTSKSEADFSPT